jgi:hypothetical protein
MTRHLALFSLGALLLLVGPTVAQDDSAGRAQRTDPAASTDLSDLSADDLPAARQLIEDEAVHRDRLARIHRLRQLAEESGDRERLDRLDDLERRQLGLHEARRRLAHAQLSDHGRATADDFVRRGGLWRARVATHQAERKRDAAQQHKIERERAANQDAQRRRQAGSPPPRGMSRSSRPSGGRSPR